MSQTTTHKCDRCGKSSRKAHDQTAGVLVNIPKGWALLEKAGASALLCDKCSARAVTK